MYKQIATIGLAALLGACGYVSEYEKAVYDLEPSYCYKSIGKVACYKEPFHRDERRLVNYFGPHPSRYDKPEAPEPTPIAAPEMVNYWVKDAEPIPCPAPTGNVASLPWLDPAVAKAEGERLEFARLNAKRDGTRALLGRMGIGPHGQFRLKPVRRFPQPDLVIPARPIIPKQAPQAALVPDQPAAQPSPQALPKPPVVEVEMN